jgi:phosphate transport system substrate-binding protein
MQVCCTNPKCNLLHKVQDHFLTEPGFSVVVPKCDCGMPLILNRRYIPTKALGHGGFGKTFLASDSNFPGSKRVIKQFSSANLLSMQIKQAEKAFERESRILDRLHHPRIPRVFSYFTIRAESNLVEGEESLSQSVFFYMAQDYVEGQDLQRELQTGKTYSEKDILILLRQILDVLDYIHNIKEPVIHCDIKLSNIIHDSQDNKYHLIDFGAFQRARIIENLSHSSSGIRFASPGFSPPEQYDGNAYASSDLYALGMTCICLLTGNTSPLDLALSEDRGQWKKQALISPNLAQVLSKMIELRSGDRYRTATDVQQALNLPPTLEHKPPIRKGNPIVKVFLEGLTQKQLFTLSVIGGISALAISALVFYVPTIISQNKPLIIPIKTYREKIQDFSSVKYVPSGTFNFGGSTTWSEIIENINPIIANANVDFHLDQTPPENQDTASSESGISMLINKKLAFAISSKGIPEDLKKEAEDKGIRLKEILVARSWFAIAVHPSLNIPGLTIKEYNQIKKGDIQNWKAIKGGPDLKIEIYSTDEKYRNKHFILVKNATEAFRKIKAYKGGLHEASVALVARQCSVKALSVGNDTNSLISPYKKLVPASECSATNQSQVDVESLQNKHYPYSRGLSVIVIENDGDHQRAGEAYANMLLTIEGQHHIQKNGYSKL